MESTQIMIRGAQGNINLHQLTCYLTQTVLLLRDRDNQAQTVILCGTGSAIPTCVLIAEIVARKLSNLSQITEFVSIESKVQEDPNNQRNYGPATGIRIKLTFQPTEEDKKAAGYQIDKVEEDKAKTWANLYEFVMMYASDLAAAKLEQAKTRRRGNDDKRRGGNNNQQQRGGERRDRQQGDRSENRENRENRGDQQDRSERQERSERPDNRGDQQVRGRGNRDRRDFRGDRQDSNQQDGNNRREGYTDRRVGQQRRPVKPQFEQNDRESNNQRSEFVRRGDPKARGSERTRGSDRHEQQEQQQMGGDRGQIRTRGGNVRQTPGQDQ